MSNPTVSEIVKEWLKANGYDGLFNAEEECGCDLSDLMPCDDDAIGMCSAGYKVNCTEACGEWHDFVEGGWHIQAKKPESKRGKG